MFEWKEDYACGIETIDEQHKVLFKMGSELYEIYQNSDKEVYPPQFGQLFFKGLQDYTVFHFTSEQKFMLLHNYPNREEHEKEHEAFLEYLNKISMDLNTKEYYQVVTDVLKFVSKWIFHHIQERDFELTEYVKKNTKTQYSKIL